MKSAAVTPGPKSDVDVPIVTLGIAVVPGVGAAVGIDVGEFVGVVVGAWLGVGAAVGADVGVVVGARLGVGAAVGAVCVAVATAEGVGVAD